MRVLTCVGDATSIRAHGGLPYHLLAAGKRDGFLDAGWSLNPEKLRGARLFWNARQFLMRGTYGGYQYSESFLRALVAQAPQHCAADEIVSIFPLLPPLRSQDVKLSIYIDATLKENFEVYGIDKLVGKSVIADALAREREAYCDATLIICRSRNAARTLVENYRIDVKKVHIVPGGANILCDPEPTRYGSICLPLTPVRLGFIGKDWRRKNLEFVLKVADVLHSRGIRTEVLAAGFNPATGPRHARLRSLGFIDKSSAEIAFIDFLRSCHFSCLFSCAEAFGLSNRESLRLGVPVLASNIGGIPDAVPEGCGHLFDPSVEAADVADVIAGYVRDPVRYWTLRDAIAERSEEFSWAAAVKKMKAIWAGSTAYAYQKNNSNDG